MSCLFESGGQSIGASASASVLPMNIQDQFLLGLIALLSLLSRGLSRLSLLQHHSLKASVLQCSAFFIVQLTYLYITTEKNHSFDYMDLTFVGKVMSLLFNMLSRFVKAFLPRSKRLLISWLQSPSVVIWSPKSKVWHCFQYFPICLPCMKWWDWMPWS